MNPRYAGKSGKVHGARNISVPAKNAERKNNGSNSGMFY
jgi:hypothetical protein